MLTDLRRLDPAVPITHTQGLPTVYLVSFKRKAIYSRASGRSLPFPIASLSALAWMPYFKKDDLDPSKHLAAASPCH